MKLVQFQQNQFGRFYLLFDDGSLWEAETVRHADEGLFLEGLHPIFVCDMKEPQHYATCSLHKN